MAPFWSRRPNFRLAGQVAPTASREWEGVKWLDWLPGLKEVGDGGARWSWPFCGLASGRERPDVLMRPAPLNWSGDGSSPYSANLLFRLGTNRPHPSPGAVERRLRPSSRLGRKG